ncbi:tRNA nuclease WapA precursor [Oxobacter pfennigii]|uniref:tRNA nuclease WapA n=2 Tax=Oxobacter pfennigii TaxID=36849 RepID=A0A0P8YDL4_9CLOT|nr:tRNA nuclease WapA precursor [Oxobacter pfennigii]
MVKSGTNISFKYNDRGIRTEKTINGVITKYHLVGDKVTFEETGSDKIYFTYDGAGKLVSMNLNGVEYFYIRNAVGNITGLLDSTGTQVVFYSYDSWGKASEPTGSLAGTVGVKNPYRYRGYRYDNETALYYLNSRYYNPEWGRFISIDAIAGSIGELLGHNLFVYVKNNFVNMEDIDGLRPIITGDLIETAEVRTTSLKYMKENWPKSQNNIVYSKTQHSQRDSGLSNLPDDVISQRARDKSLSPQERKRYVTEEKYRDLRNKGKRKNKYKSKIEFLPDVGSLVEKIGIATGLTGTALVIYIIISEGSRIIPARNLIPII